MVDTTVGPMVVVGPGASPALVAQVAAAGASAVLPDGTLLTPVPGTADMVLTCAGVAEMRSLALGDRMTVLDAVSLEQRVVVDPGRVLDAPSRTITDDAVVDAVGAAVTDWTLAGDPITVTTPTTS